MSDNLNKKQKIDIPSEEKDAVSWLQRHACSMKWELPDYEEENVSGEAHCPVFVTRCSVGPLSVSAEGTNKKLAKQNSARKAMRMLKSSGFIPVEKVLSKTFYQDVQELAQKQGWAMEFPWKQVTPYKFQCSVKIDHKLLSEELGTTRKEAREKACMRALQTLQTEPMEQPHALKVVKLALAHSDSVTQHIKVSSSGCVACIVMESKDGLEVVAMGNGTSCYCDSLQPEDPHRELVLDGHAEVLARRSLLKFFYKQLETTQLGLESIFEASGSLFKLRSDVLFHLYVSVLPCGDSKMSNESQFLRPLSGFRSFDGTGAALPSHNDIDGHWPCMGRKSEGLLRARLNTGESYSPLPQVANDPVATRMRKVTCSDKILCWNILGLQGALLSRFLEPVYLSSIIIGGKSFSHGAASRAFCCRARDVASVLTPPYRLNHPLICFVGDAEVSGQQAPAGHGGQRIPSYAWSWAKGDVLPELLDCKSGRPVHALQTLHKEIQIDGIAACDSPGTYTDAAVEEFQNSVSDLNLCAQANQWKDPEYFDVSLWQTSRSGISDAPISARPPEEQTVRQIKVTCEVHGLVMTAIGSSSSTKKMAKQAAAAQMLLNLHKRFGPIISSPRSHISGAALLAMFKATLVKPNASENSFEMETYNETKMKAAGYQAAKIALHSFFASPRDSHGQGGMNQAWISRRNHS